MVVSYDATILFKSGKSKKESVINKKFIIKALNDTLNIYWDAVDYICDVADANWDKLESISDNNRINITEHMIHNTKDNIAICNFDERFPMFPSYFRRDAIREAVGAVSSYRSNLANYEKEKYESISNGQNFKKKPPVLGTNHHNMPTFYKDNMYIPFETDSNEIELKLYIDHKWQYVKLELQKRDLKYIKALGGTLMNPTLHFAYGRFHLRYAVKLESAPMCKFENKIDDILKRRIMSIDLGINSDAVCTVMYGDGTIVARRFINLASEKAELYTLLNRKKKLQSNSGNYHYAPTKKLDTKIKGINDNLTHQIMHKIIMLALEYQVDVVVFEHLSQFKNKKRGIKVHYWRKINIINGVCKKLALYGIHYSTINPVNTSNLAYDGSGKVVRDKNNHSLCKFTTGKQYNCDLSASYNIGARYFIRALLSVCIELESKMPRPTKRTYSDLLELNKLLAA